MDTIQVSIILNEEKIKGLNPFDLQRVRKDINGIRSPYGYTYCDCLEISKNTNFIVKISYPRFFAGVNAFLISDKTQCTQVQWDFSLNLNDFKREIAAADVKIKKFKAISDYNNKYTFQILRQAAHGLLPFQAGADNDSQEASPCSTCRYHISRHRNQLPGHTYDASG